jgi:hypothetical protein
MTHEKSTTGESNEFYIGAAVHDASQEAAAPHASAREQRRALRQFVIRVLIFSAPVFLFAAVIEALLWRAGETWPLERVIRYQETHPRSFFARLMIDQGTFRYKYLQVLRQRPKILVLGSSRMMQFRAEMFGQQASHFYNGAGLVHSVEDLEVLFDRLPTEATPKILILGIDFWWLNPNEKREANDAFVRGADEDGTFRWQGHANALSQFLCHLDSLVELVRTAKRRDPDAIGLQAIFHRQGFRRDGSKRFHFKVPTTPEEWSRRFPSKEFAERDILGGGPHFAFADGISAQLLGQLRLTLEKIKTRGVLVIGYSPPLLAEWAHLVLEAPRQKEYWRDFHENVPKMFRELGIPLFDVKTPADLGLDDRYMRDGYHAHDTFNLHVLRHFCEDPQVAAVMPDVPGVAAIALSSPQTNPLYLDLPGSDEKPGERAGKRHKRQRKKTRDPLKKSRSSEGMGL